MNILIRLSITTMLVFLTYLAILLDIFLNHYWIYKEVEGVPIWVMLFSKHLPSFLYIKYGLIGLSPMFILFYISTCFVDWQKSL
jgi:hypothetical protein